MTLAVWCSCVLPLLRLHFTLLSLQCGWSVFEMIFQRKFPQKKCIRSEWWCWLISTSAARVVQNLQCSEFMSFENFGMFFVGVCQFDISSWAYMQMQNSFLLLLIFLKYIWFSFCLLSNIHLHRKMWWMMERNPEIAVRPIPFIRNEEKRKKKKITFKTKMTPNKSIKVRIIQ